MAAKKQYADVDFYENKLKKVMERLNVTQYDYDWTRQTAYVSFMYKGSAYRFEHSVEKVNALGKMKLTYGSDVFAQLVLALEDLARMVERGIYDLSVWCAGMKFLPEKATLPQCFRILGFEGPDFPNVQAVNTAYKEKAKTVHPDNGGSTNEFTLLQDAYKQCINALTVTAE